MMTLALFSAALIVCPWDKDCSAALRFSTKLHGDRLFDTVIDWIRIFGKGDVLVLMALTLGGWGFRRRGVAVLLALVISTLLVWPLKLSVARERPRGHSQVSFPSGDAAAVAAAAVPLVAVTSAVLPAATVVVAGVAFGRVYHGAHYPSDVLAGLAVGLVAGGLAMTVTRRIRFERLRRRHFHYALSICLLALFAASVAMRPNPDFLKALWLMTPVICWRSLVRLQNQFRLKTLRPVVAQFSVLALGTVIMGITV